MSNTTGLLSPRGSQARQHSDQVSVPGLTLTCASCRQRDLVFFCQHQLIPGVLDLQSAVQSNLGGAAAALWDLHLDFIYMGARAEAGGGWGASWCWLEGK